MRRKFLVLFAASALLLMACDASSLVQQFIPQKELEQAQATLQAVAPTVAAVATANFPTLAPAGATKAAPSLVPATQPPPTQASILQPTPGKVGGSASGNPLTDAFAKSQSASKYRIQLSWIFGQTENGKYQETPFFDLTGEVDGSKFHMTSKGGLLAMLAKDANTPIEMIEADGKTYMKGVSMFGLTDPKLWYVSSDSSTSGFADVAKPGTFNDFTSGAKPGDIKKVRTESFDSQSCDVYLYDMKSVQNSELLGMLGAAQDKTDFSVVDKADSSFWLCGDGYVHKFVLDYQGHDAKDATQKGAMKMNWHAWDFNNAAISVTVPKDAKPMPGQ